MQADHQVGPERRNPQDAAVDVAEGRRGRRAIRRGVCAVLCGAVTAAACLKALVVIAAVAVAAFLGTAALLGAPAALGVSIGAAIVVTAVIGACILRSHG
jgi:hypothetical protein